ncbi:glutathione S-transferase N-terminal domain-containing protein [Aurantimonas sp. VKM B-3413]|uniref:glutathione S-transferase N-terminal domain-containing protein n=1 Tax=Aurantimonas sp. VKM B-3413 TaxID=2779401 RepID=UPI001E35DB52|nr:glutathione S-transferase N-terminal domain-containing protein [Aurantimonas sp. VKM B-3413]MCB8837804.1 glutathione S-transferase N-terminal domain-containing protein [Aurantimonas sp. VKM B-3413]
MIDLYTWQTPNGEKPVIMLEECGLPYELHMIDISSGAQKAPDFLAINPNGKIPAIVDRDGGGEQRVFESGAILLYLAEKTGLFLPASGPARVEALGWTFFQVGNTGPMLGQWHHFAMFADEKIPYAIKRYRDESLRVLGVLDDRLKDRDYLAGEYSIADIINFGWVRSGVSGLKDEGARDLTALMGWIERVGSRPAVKTALKKLDQAQRDAKPDAA